jgi:2-keto-4-pentenoate hydratase
MAINGQVVSEGLGSDIKGHLFEPLVWLANMLAKREGAYLRNHRNNG